MSARKHLITLTALIVTSNLAFSWGVYDPEEYQEELPKEISDTIRTSFGENEFGVDEEKIDPTLRDVMENMHRAIYNSLLNFDDCDLKRLRCPKDENLYRPMIFNTFQTNMMLASVAQEPLFLDNKEELSLELRPLFAHQNWSTSMKNYALRGSQLGGILSIRKQRDSYFLATNLLYSNSSLRVQNKFEYEGNTIALAATGGLLRERMGSSLQLSLGGNFSKMDRDKMESRTKMIFLGASPLVVFYTKPFPIDFFVGGDVFYAHRFAFDEEGKGDCGYKNAYEPLEKVLWRLKAGPAYTFKRKTEKRLYQLLFSLAVNIQSAIPDYISYSPKVLFESQRNNKRGGWLLELGLDLSKHQKDYFLTGGIKF